MMLMDQEPRCFDFGDVPESGRISLAKIKDQGAAWWGGIKYVTGTFSWINLC